MVHDLLHSLPLAPAYPAGPPSARPLRRQIPRECSSAMLRTCSISSRCCSRSSWRWVRLHRELVIENQLLRHPPAVGRAHPKPTARSAAPLRQAALDRGSPLLHRLARAPLLAWRPRRSYGGIGRDGG